MKLFILDTKSRPLHGSNCTSHRDEIH